MKTNHLKNFIDWEGIETEQKLNFVLNDGDIEVMRDNLGITDTFPNLTSQKKKARFVECLKVIQLDSFKAGIKFALSNQRNKLNREIATLKKATVNRQ
jgi:hypothetical protein